MSPKTDGALLPSPGAASFRFTDLNAITGRSYSASLFRDLPVFVAEIVEDSGIRSSDWDRLVESGEALAAVGPYRSYSLSHWGRRIYRRQGLVPRSDVCRDCYDTGVTDDCDGSMTGTVGTPIVCFCLSG